MTKSTKIIAALGVAAGLGIAALPAGAIFADETYTFPLVYGVNTSDGKDVTVKLNVGESIALGVSKTECVGKTAGNLDLGISEAGSCAMEIAGATNAAHGFDLKVQKASGKWADLMLDGTAQTEASAKVAAVNGQAVSASNPGWNLTGGALTNFGAFDTLTTIMRTAEAAQAKNDVTYNFFTRADQQAGTYSTQLTYTIAKNVAYDDDDDPATPDAYPAETGVNHASGYYITSNN